MHKTIVSVTAVFLFATTLSAGKTHHAKGHADAQRVSAISVSGDTTTFVFQDGRSVAVPTDAVRISDPSETAPAAGHVSSGEGVVMNKGGRGKNASRLAALSQSNASNAGLLPALVRLKYAGDGSVKRARVMVFKSESAVSAFLKRGEENRAAAAKAAKSDH